MVARCHDFLLTSVVDYLVGFDDPDGQVHQCQPDIRSTILRRLVSIQKFVLAILRISLRSPISGTLEDFHVVDCLPLCPPELKARSIPVCNISLGLGTAKMSLQNGLASSVSICLPFYDLRKLYGKNHLLALLVSKIVPPLKRSRRPFLIY